MIKLIGLTSTIRSGRKACHHRFNQRLSDFLPPASNVRYPHPDSMAHRKTLIEADPSLAFRLTAFRRFLLINVLSDVPELSIE